MDSPYFIKCDDYGCMWQVVDSQDGTVIREFIFEVYAQNYLYLLNQKET